ncbi:hypothetical protein GCM10010434_086810 [Winogradskya humida]
MSTASANRTASRTCRTQYSGDVTSPADTIGIAGVPNDTPCNTRRKSSSIGSIRGEWNAWLTLSRVTLRPASRQRSATASTSAATPEMTTEFGPLTAARPTVSDKSSANSASDAWTATIAPPGGNACINEPRADTTRAASSSDHTPDTYAAASSPIE